jgi:regulator of protease activity HflC (stomatin/prohibitin superfamily)
MLKHGKFSTVGLTFFFLCIAAALLSRAYLNSPWPQLAFVLLGSYLLFAVKVVDQWERVAILRFGKYRGLRGPGLFFMVPIVDTLSRYIDQRVRVSTVSAEAALTRDTVPVNVDAIVLWLVWNAEKSILEVENFIDAITLSAQTALRESIGRHQLAQMITDRDTLGHELQKILDEKTTPWGITVQSVEIRDVRIPQGLENAMSQQARPNANARPGSFSARPRSRSPRSSPRPPKSTTSTPARSISAP